MERLDLIIKHVSASVFLPVRARACVRAYIRLDMSVCVCVWGGGGKRMTGRERESKKKHISKKSIANIIRHRDSQIFFKT